MAASIPLELLYEIILLVDDDLNLDDPPIITNRRRHLKPCAKSVSQVCARWYHFVTAAKYLHITSVLIVFGSPSPLPWEEAYVYLEGSQGSEVDVQLSQWHAPIAEQTKLAPSDMLALLTPWIPKIRVFRASLYPYKMRSVWEFFANTIEFPRLKLLMLEEEEGERGHLHLIDHEINIIAPSLVSAAITGLPLRISAGLQGMSSIQTLHLTGSKQTGLVPLAEESELGLFLKTFPHLSSLRLQEAAPLLPEAVFYVNGTDSNIRRLHIVGAMGYLVAPFVFMCSTSLRHLDLEMVPFEGSHISSMRMDVQIELPNLESLSLVVDVVTFLQLMSKLTCVNLTKLTTSLLVDPRTILGDCLGTRRLHFDYLKTLIFKSPGTPLDHAILDRFVVPRLEQICISLGPLSKNIIVFKDSLTDNGGSRIKPHCLRYVKLEGSDLESLEALKIFQTDSLQVLDMTSYGVASVDSSDWYRVCQTLLSNSTLTNLRCLSMGAPKNETRSWHF